MAGKALTITYLADARSVLAAQGQIDRGNATLSGSTGKTGGVFQTQFGSLMPIAAAAAGAAVIKFGVDSIKAFSESEQIMAQTEQRLKSTGGSANVTADDIVGLAGRLRDLSGVDDEVIQSSENLLLTFGNVRNEVGKGNDIFDRTTSAVLDYATAQNNGAIPSTDQMTAATKLLGRALNDPEAAMGRLGRAGIFLSDQQKELIRSSVAVGDTLGAQKVILDAVEQKYNGAAAAAGDTFAGKLAIVQSKLGDVQEEIGGALVPVLEGLLDVLIALAPAFSLVAKGLELLPLVNVGEDLSQLKERQDAGTSSWKDYADTVIDVLPGFGAFIDLAGDTTAALETQHGVVGDLADFYQGKYQEALAGGAEQQSNLEKATDAATQAQREQKLVILGLTDSYIGIIDASENLAEDQDTLNKLQRQGKEDTKAYDDAVLEVLKDQLSLEDAIVSYGKELVDEGKSQKQVEQALRDAGKAAGLQKDDVRQLIAEVETLIRKGEEYDGRTFTAHFRATYDPSGVPGQALQHGGIVTRPTVALIGEAGPEAVIPLSRARGLGAGVAVTVNVEGSVIAEHDLAQTVRDELIRFTRRNPDVGF